MLPVVVPVEDIWWSWDVCLTRPRRCIHMPSSKSHAAFVASSISGVGTPLLAIGSRSAGWCVVVGLVKNWRDGWPNTRNLKVFRNLSATCGDNLRDEIWPDEEFRIRSFSMLKLLGFELTPFSKPAECTRLRLDRMKTEPDDFFDII